MVIQEDKLLIKNFWEFIQAVQLLQQALEFLIQEFQPQIILLTKSKRFHQPLVYLFQLMQIQVLEKRKCVTEQFMNIIQQELQVRQQGLHIEDQVFPKRCGHLDGKQLISVDEMINKVKACVKTSKEVSNGEFIICARTDAYSVKGISETID